MGTDFGPPPQKGAKMGGSRYGTPHPNKTNAAFKMQWQEMGSGLTFSFSVLKLLVIMPAYRTTTPSYKKSARPALLSHTTVIPDHKEADQPVLLPTVRLSPSYPHVITPHTTLVTSPFFLTFLHRIPFFNLPFSNLILYSLSRYRERRALRSFFAGEKRRARRIAQRG